MTLTNVAGWVFLILGIVLLWYKIPYAEFLCLLGFCVALSGRLYSTMKTRRKHNSK